MNASPMGTMTGWINMETDRRNEGIRSGRSTSIFDRLFGRNHELARNNELTYRLLVGGGNA